MADDDERGVRELEEMLQGEITEDEKPGGDEVTDGAGGDITRLLLRWSHGEEDALDDLMAAVYDELRKLARAYLRRERDEIMQATTLVHDAFLKLIDQDAVKWQNRAHFFGIAAQAMRRILVDRAREHLAKKRGGNVQKLSLDEALTMSMERAPELVALDEALQAFAELEPRSARAVELRYFAGMTHEEIAEVLKISVPTVTRDLRIAKIWLYRELGRSDGESAGDEGGSADGTDA